LRVLVAGAAGQLGRELVAELGPEVAWSGDRAALDVTREDDVRVLVDRVRPDVIVNAAAYNKVDGAESEAGLALEVNALGPLVLARAARERGALVVHFSSDYVFDGAAGRPYREDDLPRPLGAYGVSKLAGEHLVAATSKDHLIVRTSGVFGRGGSRQKGGSFVARILEQAQAVRPLRVVSDLTFSPTYAADLAQAVIELLRSGARGLVHLTNSGACSWHDLAVETLAAAGVSATVEPITAASLGLAAPRPRFSVLDVSRARGLGLAPLRPWPEALRESLRAPALTGARPV
jgi:dTDP-4-dehydrorhamnose reductase